MTVIDPWIAWDVLSPLEQASIRDVYFGNRSVAETADRQGTDTREVTRALQSVYRRIAAVLLDPAD